MGTFTEVLGVGSSDRQRFEPVEALVDTGATYTMLPSSLLRDLGITPIETRTFILTDGQSIQRDIGEAVVQIGDRALTTLVVFADDEAMPLLGAFTLEGFSLAPDPVRQQLVSVTALAVGILEVNEDGEFTQSLVDPRQK